MKRRDFVRATSVATGGALVAPHRAVGSLFGSVGLEAGRPPADIVLRGAVIFDGTGAPGRELDVAITGARISGVGPGLAAGVEEIDLRGMALAPGFIDIHSHADLPLFVNPKAESRIRQGITLEVVGQDGSSIGPWSDAQHEDTRDRYRREYGVEIGFHDPTSFLDGIDRLRPAVNVATMVGNGTLRAFAVGHADRPASGPELALMRRELSRALEGGAVGLSSGLEYTPSAFADMSELVALASVLRGTGYPYATHMRNEDDRLLGALEEALQVSRQAGVPLQVSHLKAQGRRNYWKAAAALEMIERARMDGVDVHFDRYPYTAYQTGLANLFPSKMRAGGTPTFLQRLRSPAGAPELEAAARAKIELLGTWNAVQITSTGPATRWALGRRMGDLAEERGIDPYALTVLLLVENEGAVGMIGHGMSEKNTSDLLAHPLAMVCSDGGAFAPYGPLSAGAPHPRSYGSFPRLFAHYVRESGALSLEEAVHKVTGMPASKLGLKDRGHIRAGMYADLVAFDPATIADGATFEHPHRYPVGIPLVIVNGVVTIRDGEQSGALAGRAVRGSAAMRTPTN